MIAAGSAPGEGLRVFIGFGEAAVDGGLEIEDALEDATLEPPSGQLGEEPARRSRVKGSKR